jgi:hypothetical protein
MFGQSKMRAAGRQISRFLQSCPFERHQLQRNATARPVKRQSFPRNR